MAHHQMGWHSVTFTDGRALSFYIEAPGQLEFLVKHAVALRISSIEAIAFADAGVIDTYETIAF